MINPLIETLGFPQLMFTHVDAITASPATSAAIVQKLPVDGEAFTCPTTKDDTIVYGVIIEPEPGYENHWWGCWSCAGLYWKPDMPMPVQKAWHCVRVAVAPEPTSADWLAQLITEFVAMRDVADAALSDMPPDAAYGTHLDELVAACRAIVQTMREHEARHMPRLITVHS